MIDRGTQVKTRDLSKCPPDHQRRHIQANPNHVQRQHILAAIDEGPRIHG